MTARPRQKLPSREDKRAIQRLARQEKGIRDVNVGIKLSARERLNWLRDNGYVVDTQTDAINAAYMRVTGTLQVPPEQSN